MKSRAMNWPGYVACIAEIMLRLFHTGLLLGLFFDPEDGGDIFLRNVVWLSTDYTTLYPRRQSSS
jgi:hypothetical protein